MSEEDSKEKLREVLKDEEVVEQLESIIEEKVEQRVEERLEQETSRKETEEEEDSGISRRSFLKKLGAGAIGLGALSLSPASALDIRDSGGLEVYSGGSDYFKVDTNGQIRAETDGSASSPVWTFGSDTDSGMFIDSATLPTIANNGSVSARFSGAGVDLDGNVLFNVGGTTDAGSGDIRGANGMTIQTRNSGDSADLGVIRTNSNDDIVLGFNSNIGVIGFNGNVLADIGGTTDASSGAIRMANDTEIRARNSGNSGDLIMIDTDTNDNVRVGSGSSVSNVVINSNVDMSGNTIDNTHRIGHSDIYIDFNDHDYAEVQNGDGNREQLVAQDLFVSEDGTWLGDHISATNPHGIGLSDVLNNDNTAGQDIHSVNGIIFANQEHSNLSDREIGWDDSEGGGSEAGGLIFQDYNGDHGWIISSQDGVWDIQKNGSDQNGTINFKT
ncbi:MAG: twin-arginine translocation signal domain-containing protein [Candidatus Nanohaloarchaea archaeon]